VGEGSVDSQSRLGGQELKRPERNERTYRIKKKNCIVMCGKGRRRAPSASWGGETGPGGRLKKKEKTVKGGSENEGSNDVHGTIGCDGQNNRPLNYLMRFYAEGYTGKASRGGDGKPTS